MFGFYIPNFETSRVKFVWSLSMFFGTHQILLTFHVENLAGLYLLDFHSENLAKFRMCCAHMAHQQGLALKVKEIK